MFSHLKNYFKKDKLAGIVKYICKQPPEKFTKIPQEDSMDFELFVPNLHEFLGWGESSYIFNIGDKKVMFIVEDIKQVGCMARLFRAIILTPTASVTDLNLAGTSVPVIDKKLRNKLYKKAKQIDNYLDKIEEDIIIEDLAVTIANEELLKLEDIVNAYNNRLNKP